MALSKYISISPDEFSLCVQVANARQTSSLKSKGRDSVFKKNGWLEELTPHIIGCVGEMAVAKALGISWTGSVDTFNTVADLGKNLQVRHRSNPNWDLIVRTNDKSDDIFVLSRGMPPGAVEVVGWIRGSEAKDDKWLKDVGGYGRPSYFIPAHALKEIV